MAYDDNLYNCDECDEEDKYPRYNLSGYNVDICEECVKEFMANPKGGIVKGEVQGFNKYLYSGEKLGV